MNDLPAARRLGDGQTSGDSYIYAPQVVHPSWTSCPEPQTVDWRTTYDDAAELGAIHASNVEHDATFRVLCREIGPWQACHS
jgi:hypothetical protein